MTQSTFQDDELDPADMRELTESVGQDEAVEIMEIAKDNNLDLEQAEEVKELMDDLGVDESDAIEIADAL